MPWQSIKPLPECAAVMHLNGAYRHPVTAPSDCRAPSITNSPPPFRPPRRCQLFKQPPQPAITFITSRAHATALRRITDRTAGLAHVAAIVETTLWRQPLHLDKTKTPPIETVDCRREVAHTRRVDQMAAAR